MDMFKSYRGNDAICYNAVCQSNIKTAESKKNGKEGARFPLFFEFL